MKVTVPVGAGTPAGVPGCLADGRLVVDDGAARDSGARDVLMCRVVDLGRHRGVGPVLVRVGAVADVAVTGRPGEAEAADADRGRAADNGGAGGRRGDRHGAGAGRADGRARRRADERAGARQDAGGDAGAGRRVHEARTRVDVDVEGQDVIRPDRVVRVRGRDQIFALTNVLTASPLFGEVPSVWTVKSIPPTLSIELA